ncbi:hypothetical protein JXM83_02905 [Candidatus Woesearchaeota archaeon]|nr:hypothetical protein [Candidatus Woesearchaeota archaeon]
MNQNKLTIVIDKPVEQVFEFTTNPKYTHLWVPSIQKEVTYDVPPKVGTLYKNWDFNNELSTYQVTEFVKNSSFTLADMDKNYAVRYSYTKLSENSTQMDYFEWMREGKLTKPFTQDILNNLKVILEKQV